MFVEVMLVKLAFKEFKLEALSNEVKKFVEVIFPAEMFVLFRFVVVAFVPNKFVNVRPVENRFVVVALVAIKFNVTILEEFRLVVVALVELKFVAASPIANWFVEVRLATTALVPEKFVEVKFEKLALVPLKDPPLKFVVVIEFAIMFVTFALPMVVEEMVVVAKADRPFAVTPVDVIRFKLKLPAASETGIYCEDRAVLVAPIPSKYFALNANGAEIILLRGFRVSPPIEISRYTFELF